LESECAELLSHRAYEATLAKLQPFEFYELPPTLRVFRTVAAIRLRNYVEAFRWLQADLHTTPLLRRLEIEILCATRRHREVVQRLKQTFQQFPDNAVDFAYFAINELVFNRAFLEARLVIDEATAIFREFSPGNLHEFRNQTEFVADNERRLDRVFLDERFSLAPIQLRLNWPDMPTISWEQLLEGEFGHETAMVSDVFTALDIQPRRPARTEFYDHAGAAVPMPGLPPAKTASAFVLRRAELTEVEGVVDLATKDGVIFGQLATRSSLSNVGYRVSGRNSPRIDIDRAFILPPLGDPGYFNGVLNGVFGMLIWRHLFSEMPLLVPSGYSPALKDFATLLKLDGSRITWNQDCERVRVNYGLVFFNEGRSIDAKSLWMFQQLTSTLTGARSAISRSGRLYISRRKAAQRRLVNELELEAALRSLGFEPVCFEDLSLHEQILTCARAKVVVALHGAGLTNLAFARRLDLVVELIPRSYHVRGFENLARQLGCRYIGLFGTDLSADGDGTSWSVDPAVVRARVATALYENPVAAA
jgi:hypothetical protein